VNPSAHARSQEDERVAVAQGVQLGQLACWLNAMSRSAPKRCATMTTAMPIDLSARGGSR